jgi:hypothetical protein
LRVLRLYARTPLHAGLIVIVPTVNRAMQRTLFRAAIDAAISDGMVNRVLEVDIDGEDVTLDLYDLPPDPLS